MAIAGERLVDVHRAILLAIGLEANRLLLLAIELRHFARQLVMLLDIEPAQHAFEADEQRDLAELVADFLEQASLVTSIGLRSRRRRQHHALVDGAEELQRPVRVGALDRPRVIGAADPDQHRMRGEGEQFELGCR